MIEVLIDSFQASEPADQVHRALGADTFYPRNIVRLVPHEGEVVQDLFRGNTEFFGNFLRTDFGIAAAFIRNHGAHALSHQLHQILVSGNDDAGPAFRSCPGRIGGDDIIRLHPVLSQLGKFHGPENLLDYGNLGMEILGSLFPGGLVGRIFFMAKGRRHGIKHHRQGFRGILLHNTQEGTEKAENRRTVPPLGIKQGFADKGKIGTVNKGVSVYKIEFF